MDSFSFAELSARLRDKIRRSFFNNIFLFPKTFLDVYCDDRYFFFDSRLVFFPFTANYFRK